MGASVLPIFATIARRIAKEHPDLSDEEFDREIRSRANAMFTAMHRDVAEITEARLKEKRDRKSDPETIRRNVEICDRRKRDPKRWTLKALTKEYGFKDKRSVSLILEDEQKWRRLAAQEWKN